MFDTKHLVHLRMNTTIYVIIDLKFIWKKEKSLKLKSIAFLTFSNIKSRNVENNRENQPTKTKRLYTRRKFSAISSAKSQNVIKRSRWSVLFLIYLSSTLNKYAKNEESAERDKSTWVHIRTAMIMWNSFFPSFCYMFLNRLSLAFFGWYLSFARPSTWSLIFHTQLMRFFVEANIVRIFLYQFYSKILDDEKKEEMKKVQIKLMYTIMRSSGNVSRLFQ